METILTLIAVATIAFSVIGTVFHIEAKEAAAHAHQRDLPSSILRNRHY